MIDRCNLTVLNEPGFEDLAEFLAAEGVEIIASLPCYTKENVDRQRGDHVFESSILALQKLNALGYGAEASGLVLNLVYNPLGPSLPPAQDKLEADYKRELGAHFGIVFNRLFTLANMPIKRFGSTLVTQGKFASYMSLLHSAHNPDNLDGVMCRTLVSVDYRGYLYDCDFNQMLGIPLVVAGRPRRHLTDLLTDESRRRADLGGRPLLRLHGGAGFELRRRARPERAEARALSRMRVSIVVPARNEARRIVVTLAPLQPAARGRSRDHRRRRRQHGRNPRARVAFGRPRIRRASRARRRR